MPQFHINLRTPERFWATLDAQMTDVVALRTEVAEFVGELLREHARKVWQDEEWSVEVTDHQGAILFNLQLFANDRSGV